MQMKLSGQGYGYVAEQVAPIAHGDIILVRSASERHVVLIADDNIHGKVFVTVRLSDGAECVVLEREVTCRVRG